jgi:hypothetical protein
MLWGLFACFGWELKWMVFCILLKSVGISIGGIFYIWACKAAEKYCIRTNIMNGTVINEYILNLLKLIVTQVANIIKHITIKIPFLYEST